MVQYLAYVFAVCKGRSAEIKQARSGSVELVIPLDEDTPAALIETVAPDTLFKGADYTEAEVAGGDFVKANGELLPLLPGHSTTAALGRLNRDR